MLFLSLLLAAPPAPLSALAYRPDGQQLAVGGYGTVAIVTANGAVARHHTVVGPVTALAWSADGQRLAVACGMPGQAGRVRVFTNDASMSDFTPHKDSIYGLTFTADGQLATGSYDRLVKLSDPATGRELKSLNDHSDSVYAVAAQADGKLLASVAADRAVKLWDTQTGQRLYTLGDATDWLHAVAFRPDGREVAAAGADKSVRVWQVGATEGKLSRFTFAHDAAVTSLVWKGNTLATAAADRTVKLWDAQTLTETLVLPTQPAAVAALALSPDGRRLAIARRDGVLTIRSTADGKELQQPLPVKPKPPTVARVTPDAGPRGRLATLTITGQQLADATVSPGKLREVSATRLLVDLDLPANTPVGPLAVIVKTPGGSATVTVQVDWFPAVAEQASNDSARTAPVLPLDRTLAGRLDRAGESDSVRFDLTHGEEVGATVTLPASSKFDPQLEWRDAAGRVLASGGATIAFTAPATGRYTLSLRDREYKPAGSYRLHVGAIPVVSAVAPLGLAAGTTRDIELFGVHLPQRRVSVTAPADAMPGRKLPLPHGREVTVGEFPAPRSPGRLDLPSTADGVLAQPGQIDTYRFVAKRGERVILETDARRLGSPVDPWLELLDARGQPVPRAVLRCVAKTMMNFRDVDSANNGIRLEAWNELAIDDFILIDGELIRLAALPKGPDDDARFYAVGGQRQTYLGTSPTFHALGSAVYKVQIHPPGTELHANGLPLVTLFHRNDDAMGKDARIVFDPPADGEYRVRVGDSRSAGGPYHAYRLTLRTPRPDYRLSIKHDKPAVGLGFALPLDVTATRLDDFAGPIGVSLTDLPPGFTCPPGRIDAEQMTTTLGLQAAADAVSGTKPFKLIGEAEIAGVNVRREAMAGPITAGDPGDIVTRLSTSTLTIKPGREATFEVEIERRHGFTGRVPIDVKGLPHGLRVMNIGLNGVLITERETRRRVTIYAEPWATRGTTPAVVSAKREGKNSEHAAPALMVTVDE